MTRSAISSLFALILIPTLAAAVLAAPASPREVAAQPEQPAPVPAPAATACDLDLSLLGQAVAEPQVTPLAGATAAVDDLGLRLFADRQAASSCGPNFCSAAERAQCDSTCAKHAHGPFVGLECCTGSCRTLCICGSVPVACI